MGRFITLGGDVLGHANPDCWIYCISRSVQGREDEEEDHDWVHADIRLRSVQGWLEDDRHG